MNALRVRTPRRRVGALASAASAVALLGLTALPLQAQFRGGDQGFQRPGAQRTLVAGARAGFDFQGDAPVVGGFARTSVVSRFAVQGSAEATFLDGLTERQFGGDLLYTVGPGLSVGGGPVWRYSAYDVTPGSAGVQETRVGYSLALILGGSSGPGRVITGLEFRYTKVDELDPQTLSIQLGFALARW